MEEAISLVVAGMATMPTRRATLPIVLDRILKQVSRLYLYCDGHIDIPAAARSEPRIVPILSRDIPNLRGSGKFFGLNLLERDSLYLGIDDDICYPDNYVQMIQNGNNIIHRALVGYHACVLQRPFERYLKGRRLIHFGSRLHKATTVDVIGSGTAAFSTQVLRFDPRAWPDGNMVDLCLSIEATRRGLPLVSLPRKENFIRPLEELQSDSVYRALLRDDSRQTALARTLLSLQDRRDDGSPSASFVTMSSSVLGSI